MSNLISYGRQSISDDDVEAVVEALRSDYLTQGPIGETFENAFSEKVEVKYSTSFNNATSALHGACVALDVGPADYVWTSPISFVASANCAIYCGAKIDFVDIDLETYNINAVLLQEKLIQAEVLGRLPKVLIVVHMCGQPCEMADIERLSKIYGFKIIEDASHATGAKYRSKPVGSCEYSDISVFSFHSS